jgi:glutamine amidotransferase
MKSNTVTIIDYGVGNLLSVARALEYCGAKVFISRKKKQIISSSKIILPGVGAFGEAVKKLKKYDLFDVIKETSNLGTPILGICVGMQLLMDQSEEFGFNKGLSLISGKVVSVPKSSKKKELIKTPYIGWQKVFFLKNLRFKLNHLNNRYYFLHSFMVQLNNNKNLSGYYSYRGNKITAVIKKDNIIGCQFHPERSGPNGLNFLKNFLNI